VQRKKMAKPVAYITSDAKDRGLFYGQ